MWPVPLRGWGLRIVEGGGGGVGETRILTATQHTEQQNWVDICMSSSQYHLSI